MTDYTDLIAALRLPIHGAQQEWTCRKAADALEALASEVETLRMKLAACGVGALSNTERTIKNNRIGPDSPYWSASLGDVYYIVDKEMEARTERDRLKGALEDIDAVAIDFGYFEPAARTMKEHARKALGDAS